MKYLSLLTAIVVFGSLSAQENNIPYWLKKYKKPQLNTFSDLIKKYGDQQTAPLIPETNPTKSTIVFPKAKLSFVLSNGNKAYTLPQDHMLCIVPDMTQYNRATPVQPYQYKGPGAIPNPAGTIQSGN